jgi:hypothetical protein
MMLRDLDERLQYGPGMRVQRVVEAGFLVAAFFMSDLRFAYVTLALVALQAVSGRLALIALAVALFVPPPKSHSLGDLYFDLAGSRGACAISVCVMSTGIALARAGHESLGYLVLAMPAASLVLAPTVGFCCGCAVYVTLRNALVWMGILKGYAHGICDVDIEHSKTPGHQ